MTPERDVSRETSTAWRQYLDREHAARDMYLRITARAHHEYLGGPWPDRDAYLMVEREAYATYYQAGRHAWNIYRDAMDTLPPDIVALGPAATAARDEWIARNPKQPNKPPQASYPYPPPDRGSNYAALNHGQATFTPYPEGAPLDYPAAHREWVQAPSPNPESES